MTTTTESTDFLSNDALAQKAALFQAVPQSEWVNIASDDLQLELNAAKFQICQWAAAKIITSAHGRELTFIELAAFNALCSLSFCEALCVGICRSVDGLADDAKDRVGRGLRQAVPALKEDVDGLFFMPSDWHLYDEMRVIFALPNLERETIPTFVHKFAGHTLRLHDWPPQSRIELKAYSSMMARLTPESLAEFWTSSLDLHGLIAEGCTILAQETEAPKHAQTSYGVLACEMNPQSIAAMLLLARAAIWSGGCEDGETVRATIQDIADRSSMVQRQPGAEAAVRLACSLGELLHRN